MLPRRRFLHQVSSPFDEPFVSMRLCTSTSRAQVIQVYLQRTRTSSCHLSSGITTGTVLFFAHEAWKEEWKNYWILGISSRTLGLLYFSTFQKHSSKTCSNGTRLDRRAHPLPATNPCAPTLTYHLLLFTYFSGTWLLFRVRFVLGSFGILHFVLVVSF